MTNPEITVAALVIDPAARKESGLRQIREINRLKLAAKGYTEVGRFLPAGDGKEQEVVFYAGAGAARDDCEDGNLNGPATALWWHFCRDAMGQFLSGPVVVLGGEGEGGVHCAAPGHATETYSRIVTGRYYTGLDIADYRAVEQLGETWRREADHEFEEWLAADHSADQEPPDRGLEI